ncbi:hypothetical protein NDU88_005488 [Pleurodeles waltl]|uniref:Uncharacterized protein n=1 Tax=Pleurodeles waltl TaxID=8319 RepID=A0AAV7UJ43_PLEWA|nr:hypothetical protein NDU88_005488 [Pleurodeles waltl]
MLWSGLTTAAPGQTGLHPIALIAGAPSLTFCCSYHLGPPGRPRSSRCSCTASTPPLSAPRLVLRSPSSSPQPLRPTTDLQQPAPTSRGLLTQAAGSRCSDIGRGAPPSCDGSSPWPSFYTILGSDGALLVCPCGRRGVPRTPGTPWLR